MTLLQKVRLRVEDFLKKHEEYLAGELKSAIVKEKRKEIKTKTERRTKTITKKEKKVFKDESIFLEFPSLLENWKGLGKNKRKTKKPRSMQVRKIPLLLNGSRSRSGVENVLLTNTCAFDAVSQTIAAGCIDGFDLNTSVLNSDDMFCQFITAMIDPNNIKQDLYKLRVEMLERFFEKNNLII